MTQEEFRETAAMQWRQHLESLLSAMAQIKVEEAMFGFNAIPAPIDIPTARLAEVNIFSTPPAGSVNAGVVFRADA